MKLFKNILMFIFSAFIIGAALIFTGYFVYVGWLFLSGFAKGARSLEPNIYVPLGITVLTAILGLSATLYTQARIRKREIESAFRERKIEIYLDFLEKLETLIIAQKPELGVTQPSENELAIGLIKVRTKAVLWGSVGVLKALNDFSKVGRTEPIEMFTVFDTIQREMRKDLGLSNKGLGESFFIKLILSDPSEFDKMVLNKR